MSISVIFVVKNAIEQGYMQKEIAQSAYKWQKGIESGENVIVGVNRYREPEGAASSLFPELKATGMKVSPEMEKRQIRNLKKVKQARSERDVAQALEALGKACREEKNLMPFFMDAVKAYCTIGEICDVLRQSYGEYVADTYF